MITSFLRSSERRRRGFCYCRHLCTLKPPVNNSLPHSYLVISALYTDVGSPKTLTPPVNNSLAHAVSLVPITYNMLDCWTSSAGVPPSILTPPINKSLTHAVCTISSALYIQHAELLAHLDMTPTVKFCTMYRLYTIMCPDMIFVNFFTPAHLENFKNLPQKSA